MLMELRASGAKDARMRQAFYQKVIQSLDMGESNYLLLLASDSYDVPRRPRAAGHHATLSIEAKQGGAK